MKNPGYITSESVSHGNSQRPSQTIIVTVIASYCILGCGTALRHRRNGLSTDLLLTSELHIMRGDSIHFCKVVLCAGGCVSEAIESVKQSRAFLYHLSYGASSRKRCYPGSKERYEPLASKIRTYAGSKNVSRSKRKIRTLGINTHEPLSRLNLEHQTPLMLIARIGTAVGDKEKSRWFFFLFFTWKSGTTYCRLQ